MPMIEELLTKLKETPPDTEDELRAMLDETGYDLVMKEPGGEGEEAPPPEGEEEMPPEGPPGEAEEEGPPEDVGKLMGGLFGGGPPKGKGKRDLSPGGMSAIRIRVAEKQFPKKGGKR